MNICRNCGHVIRMREGVWKHVSVRMHSAGGKVRQHLGMNYETVIRCACTRAEICKFDGKVAVRRSNA